MKKDKKINVLFTCIGRRVSLLRSFRRAAEELGLTASFYGTDSSELSPAFQLCDKGFKTSRVESDSYIDEILSIVKEQEVGLLVPTVDLDLKILAEKRDKFSELGCFVLVSGAEVVDICQDKLKTYQFLCEHKFGTAKTMSYAEAASQEGLEWPCFLKPQHGYASRGNAVVKSREELEFYGERIPDCIVQNYIEGEEYTCDVYVDFDMEVRCVVPRRRLEIRAGEVSKSRIVKAERIMSEGKRLVELLEAGPGVITLQLFVTEGEKLKFIEVNPRFGGGVPLSIKAGADFPKWLLQGLGGEKLKIEADGFKDGLTMLRYDDEVWFAG